MSLFVCLLKCYFGMESFFLNKSKVLKFPLSVTNMLSENDF